MERKRDETQYYLSSLPLVVVFRSLGVYSSYWGIKHGLHWTLDMTYREDASPIWDARAHENFAWFNRFKQFLFKLHPKKQSVATKYRLCGWNGIYLQGCSVFYSGLELTTDVLS